MVAVVVKVGNKKVAKAVDSIVSANTENPRLIIGGKPRTKEEKAEIKKELDAIEKERLARISSVKKKIDADKKSGLSDSQKKELAKSEILKTENDDLRAKLSSAVSDKKAGEKSKDDEIEKLKSENEELAKNSQSTSGKPAKINKK